MSQSLFFMLPYDWANSMVVLGVILQNGCGIQGPDFLIVTKLAYGSNREWGYEVM